MNFVVDGRSFCAKTNDRRSTRIKIGSKQTADSQPENLTVRDLPPIDIELLEVILLHKSWLMF